MNLRRPDLAWYTGISERKDLPPRCPFGSVHRCPRYYQSVWLLGQYAGTTQIKQAEDEALLKRWQGSDLWPAIREQETSIFGPEGDPKLFRNFCPEVTFDRFGWFAAYLHHYTDEIDVGIAHARLGREGTRGEDWRWTWESIEPMHYTECPLYSLLLSQPGRSTGDLSQRDELVDLRPNFYGLSVNLNPLVSRLKKWWRKRRTSVSSSRDRQT
jgi:hypothetical protein